jgi:hypothetical protein
MRNIGNVHWNMHVGRNILEQFFNFRIKIIIQYGSLFI